MFNLNKKGQNTLEYAVVIAVIVAALLAMQNYIKRGIQGKMKASTDDIGEQFSPQYTASNSIITLNANSNETINGGAAPTTSTNTNQIQTRNSNENIGELQTEYWK